MIPTTDFLISNFINFNCIYFKNKLKIPTFKLGTVSGYWGRFLCDGDYNIFTYKVLSCKNPTIEMTTVYSRDEKSVLNTLLHEMIHYYVTSILKIYEEGHGDEFNKIAEKVNKDGWDIQDSNIILSTDIYVGKKASR